MNTILIYTLRRKNLKFGKPLEKFRNLEIFKPLEKFSLLFKNLEFRKPLDLKFSGNLDSDDLKYGPHANFQIVMKFGLSTESKN